MRVRRYCIVLAVAFSGGALSSAAEPFDPAAFDFSSSRSLCPVWVKEAPIADLPAIGFPEELQLHDKNPSTSAKVMAFRKIKLSARGTEGHDRAVNRFLAMDVLHGKTLVDDQGLAQAANDYLKKTDRFAAPIKWVDGQEAQLLSTQPKVVFPTFTANADGAMNHYGLEIGTQRLFLLDLPSGETTLLTTVKKTTGRAPSVELLHDERYLKINPHFHSGEPTEFTFADMKTGKVVRIEAPPNQDLTVSGDGKKILSAYVYENESPDRMNRVVTFDKEWQERLENAPLHPLSDVGPGVSFPGKVWSSSDDLGRHVVDLNPSVPGRPAGIPRLKWIDLATGRAIQKDLPGWKGIRDQLRDLQKKGMTLGRSRPGKATFSADGRYLLVQLDLSYAAVPGSLPENFVWSGVWDLQGKEGPRIVTSENMKVLHELDIGPRASRREFFHDAVTQTHLAPDGTFIAVRAEPREVGGGKAQIRVLVLRTSRDGVSETRAYVSEPLDLDAVHQHGSTNTGVHSLRISPDGKTVSFEPTGNGSRVVKIVW